MVDRWRGSPGGLNNFSILRGLRPPNSQKIKNIKYHIQQNIETCANECIRTQVTSRNEGPFFFFLTKAQIDSWYHKISNDVWLTQFQAQEWIISLIFQR